MSTDKTTHRRPEVTLGQCAMLGIALAISWATFDHWRAWHAEAIWKKEWSVRGFMGCEGGHYVVRNIDFGDQGSWKGPAINLPDGNACSRKEQTP
jgi:hypothetical protein